MIGYTTSAQLVPELRWALQRLYDQVSLRKSKLIPILDVEHHKEPVLSLRRLLTEAIESLKPDSTVPPQAGVWRTYHILAQRYVEQLTQREVATDLGLSLRQLQREERRALRTLAEHLWLQHGLERQAPVEPTDRNEAMLQSDAPTRAQELDWLRRSVPSETVKVTELLQSLLEVVRSLAEATGVRVEYDLPESMPPLAVQRATIRQALLVVLTAGIRSVPGGRVHVRAELGRWAQCAEIRAMRGNAISVAPAGENLNALAVARELVALSGGSLQVVADDSGQEPFIARVTLPSAEQVSVLIVDDNADALRLFQRYLADTRYRYIGARNAEEMAAAVESHAPEIIVLDVMLPGVDGWELLGRLRAYPKTCEARVIICTILPQEQLALSLGAAAFLAKPVTRQTFLAALDRQLALLAKQSR